MLEGERDKEREKGRERQAAFLLPPVSLLPVTPSFLPSSWTTLQPCFEPDQDPLPPRPPRDPLTLLTSPSHQPRPLEKEFLSSLLLSSPWGAICEQLNFCICTISTHSSSTIHLI